MVHPSKSNSRHLVRRACFNLPKLSAITTAQSSASSVNPVHQPSSPTSQSTTSIDTSLTTRKGTLHDHLGFNSSQSKEAPSRGISPRINRNTATSNVYNPSTIERL